ncbi:WXG100 family type VII secretion target [Glycomyces buryatensis]|uniref:PPE domain-containing protein n=1 Tax=Glycomyces buryatensis TaxID=2570927 RepID=A0A4S8QF07_9ACTN|nr:PPE domain-containing protein [Glycomyces buryatensis]THV42261.1 PPE domain-containing protein [Glycomyces buryatensis]
MSDNSLIAAPVESTKPWTGFGPADATQGIFDAVESRSWVATTLAGVGAGFEVASWALDPWGSLVSSGLSFLMEQCGPIRDLLQELTGDPDILLTHAGTWTNMALDTHSMAEEMWTLMEEATAEWEGEAAESYRTLHTAYINAIDATGWMFDAMASATNGAATIVQVAYELVRDLIAELLTWIFFKSPVWLAIIAASAGLGIPICAAEAGGRIFAITSLAFGVGSALVASFQGLQALLAD